SSKLCISKPTIRSHLSSIFKKLAVERRSQLGHLLATQNHQ
ncbi:MAG TPA: DNA-binding response regulator, partial [Gammaproteobacteria bacterium]|nr:DNA-binding response regulator [Gammaproteobacteria bacterium]